MFLVGGKLDGFGDRPRIVYFVVNIIYYLYII